MAEPESFDDIVKSGRRDLLEFGWEYGWVIDFSGERIDPSTHQFPVIVDGAEKGRFQLKLNGNAVVRDLLINGEIVPELHERIPFNESLS